MEREIKKEEFETAVLSNSTTLLFEEAALREDTKGFIGLIAQSINGEAAARAVVGKVKQIAEGVKNLFRRPKAPRVVDFGGGDSPISPPIPPPPLTPKVFRFRWETEQDNRVCEKCSRLEGMVFEFDDPIVEMIIPSASERTHLGCRCRYEPTNDADFSDYYE